MPITAPYIADFQECFSILVKTVGVQSANDPSGATVAVGAAYSATDLRNRLKDADYEFRIKICESQDNPFRELYFRDAELTDWIGNETFIPAGVAHHSTAWIKDNADALDATKKRAKLAINLYEVEKCQEPADFSFYGSPKQLFFIHSGRVYLAKTDAVIRFDVPKLLKTANTLYSPDAYKWGVIALAVTKCFVVGTNEAQRNYWAGVLSTYYQMVEGRALSLPEPEQLKRLG